MNMFGATLENADKPTSRRTDAEYELPPSVARAIADFKRFGSTVTLGIRPESVRISDAGKIAATVRFYEPLGGSGIVGLDVGDVTVNVITDGKTAYARGEKCGSNRMRSRSACLTNSRANRCSSRRSTII